MTVVVADTSPINYLLLIGEIALLHSLYGEVVVPPEVLAELTDPAAPPVVLRWIDSRPDWLQLRRGRKTQHAPLSRDLDPGEHAAILLAMEESDVLLLMDDAAGRAEADRQRIPNTGKLGVLRAAAIRQLVDLPSALNRLAETNFRASRILLADLLAEDLERKQHLDE